MSSRVIGSEPYQELCDTYHKPFVITGFEPLDILQAILMLVTQIVEKRCEVENQYKRIVPLFINQGQNLLLFRTIQLYFCLVPRNRLSYP